MKSKAATSRLVAADKLTHRCVALADLLPGLSGAWQSQSHDTQRDLIETLVGAALWYLPKVPGLWTGLVSTKVLHACREGRYVKRRPSEEHLLPRKVAARQLFQISDWPRDAMAREIERRYRVLYGRYNFVTTSENKALVRFQRCHVFVQPSMSYQQANIEFRRISEAELQSARRGDGKVIDAILASPALTADVIDQLTKD